MLEKKIRLILSWPPNSPDLSVIENVWGILKLRIATRGPKIVEEFTERLQEEWDNLEMSGVNWLFLSIQYRFEMCLKLEGKCISHLVRNNVHRRETE
jgi:transposase